MKRRVEIKIVGAVDLEAADEEVSFRVNANGAGGVWLFFTRGEYPNTIAAFTAESVTVHGATEKSID